MIKNFDEFLKEHNQNAKAGKESGTDFDLHGQYTILQDRLSRMYDSYIQDAPHNPQKYAALVMVSFQSEIKEFDYKIPLDPNNEMYSEIKEMYDSIYNTATKSNVQSASAVAGSQRPSRFSGESRGADKSQEIPVSVQRLQTFLINKSDSYYMQNIRPLFPIQDEPHNGIISRPDLQNLFENRNLVRDIAKMTNNPQLVSRIYASALAVGLNSNRESLAVQENFGKLESTVQQFVEAGILDKNRLPKIAQDRLESMDKQRGGRHQ